MYYFTNCAEKSRNACYWYVNWKASTKLRNLKKIGKQASDFKFKSNKKFKSEHQVLSYKNYRTIKKVKSNHRILDSKTIKKQLCGSLSQFTFCIYFRKGKIKYFTYLNERDVTDNNRC